MKQKVCLNHRTIIIVNGQWIAGKDKYNPTLSLSLS